MKFAKRLSLVLVTDRRRARRPLAEAVAHAVAGGVTAVILREKDLSTAELVALGAPVRDACRHGGALFLVNGDVEAAKLLGADGVHLPAAAKPIPGAHSGGARFVGRSVHEPQEVTAAVAQGADYVVFGPVYETPSKQGVLAPRGPALLLEAVRMAGRLPVVALGGVTPQTMHELRRNGASGVACIRAILDADDERAAAAALSAAWGPVA
jgi:thiamine-phosphate pyrophosphorylase